MGVAFVGGEAFAVDASMIVADVHRRRSVAKVKDLGPTSSRAVAEYLSALDDAAFGGATAEDWREEGAVLPLPTETIYEKWWSGGDSNCEPFYAAHSQFDLPRDQ